MTDIVSKGEQLLKHHNEVMRERPSERDRESVLKAMRMLPKPARTVLPSKLVEKYQVYNCDVITFYCY